MEGNLIIVSAPSGAGKTTLVAAMLARVEGIQPSVSYTSRKARAGERPGAHYHFVGRAEFEAMIEREEFLEWAEVHGNLYGTSRRQVGALLEAGFDVVLTIDVQGATNARRLFPEAVGVFILPPSFEVLQWRLEARGADPADELRLRVSNAQDELAHYRHFDFLIINDDLERAAAELSAIVIAARCRRAVRAAAAEEILRTFARELK
jgi:guanylate kinase